MTKILSVDPGTINTGFAAATIQHHGGHPRDWAIRFEDIGIICPGDREHLDRRRHVTGTLRMLASQHQSKTLLVEEPPQTMYNQEDYRGENAVHQVIARAQSVLRVGTLASWIMASFDEKVEVLSILPVQWQQRMKSRAMKLLGNYKELDVKQVSLAMANLLLQSAAHEYFRLLWSLKSKRSISFPLETGKESNVADAVNILYNFYITWQMRILETME